MRKILIFTLSIFLVMSIFACGSKENNEQAKTLNIETETQTVQSDSKETTSTKNQEKTLSDIEQFLKDKGVLLGEKTKMAAEMVGAIDGFKYSDCKVEVYEYDTESEEYKKISNGDEIPLKGMEGFFIKATSVNGKFVLIGNVSQEVIDAFETFK